MMIKKNQFDFKMLRYDTAVLMLKKLEIKECIR